MKKSILDTYYIILIVLGVSFLIFVSLIVIFIFKAHVTINLTGSNENDNIIAITGIASAVLVYLGFRLQAKQLRISNANRDFDRYNKMIDEIPLYESKICLKYIIVTERTGKDYVATSYEAIDLYLDQFYIWDAKKHSDKTLFNQDLKVFYRNVYILLNYITFIFESFKKLDKDNLDILSTKLIYNIPQILIQCDEVLNLESEISKIYIDEFSKDFIKNFKDFKNELEIITKHISGDEVKKENKEVRTIS